MPVRFCGAAARLETRPPPLPPCGSLLCAGTQRQRPGKHADKWGQLKIFLDSPLAQRFTELYRELQPFWDDEARARRMASLMERVEGARAAMKAPQARPAAAPKAPEETFAPVRQALAANHAAQQSLNRARRSLDEDLFAA